MFLLSVLTLFAFLKILFIENDTVGQGCVCSGGDSIAKVRIANLGSWIGFIESI